MATEFENTIRSRRLSQIFWVTEIALFAIFLLQLFEGYYFEAGIIIAVALITFISLYFIKKQQFEIGGNILVAILTLAMLLFMWQKEGIRDEALLVYPAIVIFSIFIGSRRLSLFLFAVIIVNVVLIGYLNHSGILQNSVASNSLKAVILIVIFITVISYSIWLVITDMKNAYLDLAKENKRYRESQKQVDRLINYDLLTGVSNRKHAKERFLQSLGRQQRSGKKLCLMFIDLDDFKTINDTLGHHAGDEYLKHIASCLTKSLRDIDTVCRLGGDEFLVLAENIESRENVAGLASKISSIIKQPAIVGNNQISTTSSIGVAVVPDDGCDFETLCRRADIALYKVKDSGKDNFCFFDQKMAEKVNDSLTLISDLQSAIGQKQLQLLFQPQFDLSTGAVIGAEALIRWHHPSRGIIPPAKFIPLAERSGLIGDIGSWIINKACATCAEWIHEKQENQDFVMSVNISPIQVKRENLAELVLSRLEKFNLKGQNLELELPEPLFLDESMEVKNELAKLKNSGVRLSIDDFGSGFSNLCDIMNFDISRIKIDRTFLRNISENKPNRAIIHAIIKMADSLAIGTVAEGVEDASTVEMLKSYGCKAAQGYHWTRPLNAEQFREFRKKHG